MDFLINRVKVDVFTSPPPSQIIMFVYLLMLPIVMISFTISVVNLLLPLTSPGIQIGLRLRQVLFIDFYYIMIISEYGGNLCLRFRSNWQKYIPALGTNLDLSVLAALPMASQYIYIVRAHRDNMSYILSLVQWLSILQNEYAGILVTLIALRWNDWREARQACRLGSSCKARATMGSVVWAMGLKLSYNFLNNWLVL